MAGPQLGAGGERKRWHSVELEGLGSLARGLIANLQEALSKLQASQKKGARSKKDSRRSGSERAVENEERMVQSATVMKEDHDVHSDVRPRARTPPPWLAALIPPVKKMPLQNDSPSPIRLASLTMASPQSSNHHRHLGPFGQPSSFHLPVDVTWGAWDDDDISDDVDSADLSVSSSGEDNRELASAVRGGEVSTSKGEEGEALCYEIVKGRKRRYVKGAKGSSSRGGKAGYTVVEEGEKRNPFQILSTFACSYVVPEGFPETVSAAYAPYMRWRAAQYFFGGAMGVFTTRSLLHSIGVSRGGAPTAVAVNWAIKDGAGRIGKMLFARQGKKFDCDLKQVRFAGGLLMELGAAVELATTVCPQFFLPLACAANISKNVAAVTATSTRAPIYKAFARRENLGDVTAKGESISNMADLMGMGFGILLSKRNPSLLATFGVLSCGYLLSSYNECRSIQLPTLNRARFSVAVRTFLESGSVPAPTEANRREAIIVPPWAAEKPMELGVKVSEAFGSAHEFQSASQLFKDEKYMVTYRKKKRRAFVVLKEDAQAADVLRAAFQAHVLLHILHGCPSKSDGSSAVCAPGSGSNSGSGSGPLRQEVCALPRRDGKQSIRKVTEDDVAIALRQSCAETSGLYEDFRKKASAEGWVMADALLNPGDARLCNN